MTRIALNRLNQNPPLKLDMATSETPRFRVRRKHSAGKPSDGEGEVTHTPAEVGRGRATTRENAVHTLHTFFEQLPSPNSPHTPTSHISLYGEKSEAEDMLAGRSSDDEEVEEIYLSAAYAAKRDAHTGVPSSNKVS